MIVISHIFFWIATIDQINGLSQCFYCVEAVSCGTNSIDYCNGHDSCSRMTFINANGQNVTTAKCDYASNCGDKNSKLIMCRKKESCQVTMCCNTDNCNFSSSTWIKIEKRMFFLVAMVFALLLYI
ncbi:uncharacterized protein LOC136080046 [Hydra vulgaris]|uniref:Uncharacterized protein LOC136080046 n=1 Tax=Hydra vulgaris TaxID=6087 RepID=A0ABM4BU85_HYDVU